MPKISLADTIMDWEKLIQNASQHADLPGFGERLAELRTLLERAREIEARRARLDAERQTATRELAATKQQGKALTSRIRSELKAVYGITSDRLVAFGMRPRPLGRGDAPEVMMPLASRTVASEGAEEPPAGEPAPRDQDR
jgi:hypothetical protein